MNKLIEAYFNLTVIALFFSIQSVYNEEYANNETVWPYPQYMTTSVEYYSIDSTKVLFKPHSEEKCEIIDKAIDRYKQLIFLQDCSKLGLIGVIPNAKLKRNFTGEPNYNGLLESITIQYDTCEQWPHFEMNENYTLSIDNNTANIFAQTNWGAIRALETFSQIVRHVGVDQFTINRTQVADYPRFSHRGVMLDTARHYIPVHILKKNLDALSYNKLNVFHWHIVDDQSFPYVSDKYPDLSKKGAFDAETHIYTTKHISDIIEYARERGIRVIAEFDTPGHTKSWGKARPELLAECYTGEKPNGEFGPIDPSNQSVFSFVESLFDEIVGVFPDQYIHLGGDEVHFDCWQNNPKIQAFMSEKQFGNDYRKLEEYYMQRVLDIVSALNRSYIVWEDVYNNGVNIKADTVVHVWKGTNLKDTPIWRKELLNVTQSGFKALLSSCWYFNHVAYGSDWYPYYECEPISFNGSAQQNSLVLGGEACIWSEYVDSSNIISRLWPRAITTAERLWSSDKHSKAVDAVFRYNRHRCLMQSRGIRGQPESPGFCRCDYAI